MISWNDGRKPSGIQSVRIRVGWTDGSTHIFNIRYNATTENPLWVARDRVRAGFYTSKETGTNSVAFGIVNSVELITEEDSK